MSEYKEYMMCQVVKATPMTRGDYNAYQGWENQPSENPSEEGYHIIFHDGSESWWTKDDFGKIHRPLGGMTFGMAIDALKAGYRVAREGWNGKGMFLWLKPGTTIKAEWCKDEELKTIAEANGGEIEALGTICMKTADNKILSGWSASQTDMLAEDWTVNEFVCCKR